MRNRGRRARIIDRLYEGGWTATGLLCMPGGGSACPPTVESLAAGLHYLRMDGKETFKRAVTAMSAVANEALRRCELDISRSNASFRTKPTAALSTPSPSVWAPSRTSFSSTWRNMATRPPARVAIALYEAVECGRIQRGDLVIMVVFGAGLTWGAAIIEW